MLHKNHPVTVNVLLTLPRINSYYTRVTHMITQVFPISIYIINPVCVLLNRATCLSIHSQYNIGLTVT